VTRSYFIISVLAEETHDLVEVRKFLATKIRQFRLGLSQSSRTSNTSLWTKCGGVLYESSN
jgi:hypothetical protein